MSDWASETGSEFGIPLFEYWVFAVPPKALQEKGFETVRVARGTCMAVDEADARTQAILDAAGAIEEFRVEARTQILAALEMPEDAAEDDREGSDDRVFRFRLAGPRFVVKIRSV